jgi:hypothetical protein
LFAVPTPWCSERDDGEFLRAIKEREVAKSAKDTERRGRLDSSPVVNRAGEGDWELTGEPWTVFLKDLVVRDLTLGERKMAACADVARARRTTGKERETCMITRVTSDGAVGRQEGEGGAAVMCSR